MMMLVSRTHRNSITESKAAFEVYLHALPIPDDSFESENFFLQTIEFRAPCRDNTPQPGLEKEEMLTQRFLYFFFLTEKETQKRSAGKTITSNVTVAGPGPNSITEGLISLQAARKDAMKMRCPTRRLMKEGPPLFLEWI